MCQRNSCLNRAIDLGQSVGDKCIAGSEHAAFPNSFRLFVWHDPLSTKNRKRARLCSVDDKGNKKRNMKRIVSIFLDLVRYVTVNGATHRVFVNSRYIASVLLDVIISSWELFTTATTNNKTPAQNNRAIFWRLEYGTCASSECRERRQIYKSRQKNGAKGTQCK